MSHSFYYKYSDYLKAKYKEKVYKLPVSLPVSCPNRIDGSGGCTFCAGAGTGFEILEDKLPVKTQLLKNMNYIGSKYHAKKFIAYFQNYTNTYMPLTQFKKYMIEAASIEHIVEISISTRPDCIGEAYLEFLDTLSKETGIDIHFELGLQTVNYHTLDSVCRGHGLAEFIDSVLRIKKYHFTIGVHMILNLPCDTIRDALEGARVLSSLPIDVVKLHSLYIAKDSKMASDYAAGQIHICDKAEYFCRLKIFLENLRPDIAVERLFSRIPEKDSLFCNWGTSWWKLSEEFESIMTASGSCQGICYNNTNYSKL